MKKQILFLHSAGPQGTHEGSSDLVAWLSKELSHDYNVHFPIMPNPDDPDYAAWQKKIEQELHAASDGIVLVGHSLGGSVLLKHLSEHPFNKKIAAIFLIATPYWGKGMEEYMLDDDFASRLPPVPVIFLYHSQGDEIVPFSHLKAYAEKLPRAFVHELEGDDHGFSKGIPQLVKDIRSLQ